MRRTRTQQHKILLIKAQAFVLASVLVVSLFAVYVTLLGVSVKNVVLRKDVQRRVATMRADVSELEGEYLRRTADVTLERADGLGLTTVASKSYAKRAVLVGQAY